MSTPPTPSVVLSQDLASALAGINLKWVNTGLSTIREVSLVYFQNVPNADIGCKDIASGLLKCNLPSGFISGQMYSFQLQIVDVTGVMVFSNTLVVTSAWMLVPPIIDSFSGGDSSLAIQLAPTSNVLSASDSTVEFVLKRDDNVMFWIIKSYVASGQYRLTNTDSSSLVNNIGYRVACMYQPTDSNSRYTAPSLMSNSISATPSNVPNVPASASLVCNGGSQLSAIFSWTPPSDFAEWSSNYSMILTLESSTGVVIVKNQIPGVSDYVWTEQSGLIQRGLSYRASVRYVNPFGTGPALFTSFMTPFSNADAPVLLSATEDDTTSRLTWYPPSFAGQSTGGITSYRVYKNGSTHIATVQLVAANTNANGSLYYVVTGLLNGSSATYEISAMNSSGESLRSSVLTASPYGQMSIVSVVASGKTLTATINPNGRAVERVVFIAMDQDPSASEASTTVADILQQSISQNLNGTVQVIQTFSGFSSDISFWCAIANNSINSAFLKSA